VRRRCCAMLRCANFHTNEPDADMPCVPCGSVGVIEVTAARLFGPRCCGIECRQLDIDIRALEFGLAVQCQSCWRNPTNRPQKKIARCAPSSPLLSSLSSLSLLYFLRLRFATRSARASRLIVARRSVAMRRQAC
jgi:hypothetical protein